MLNKLLWFLTICNIFWKKIVKTSIVVRITNLMSKSKSYPVRRFFKSTILLNIYLPINIIYYYTLILLCIQYENDNRRHDCEWYSWCISFLKTSRKHDFIVNQND